ncbi:hypothetical protein D6T26_25180, partial [Salmonella enterica subsp. enterica serovar Typhi]|nr:hypothetical protein [Salmonella enterica subsp. enterica serovar Typhi]
GLFDLTAGLEQTQSPLADLGQASGAELGELGGVNHGGEVFRGDGRGGGRGGENRLRAGVIHVHLVTPGGESRRGRRWGTKRA